MNIRCSKLTRLAGAAGLVLALSNGGCEQVLPDITWERMLDQNRGDPYAASTYFSDGKLMQAPPEHTLPVEASLAPRPLREGLDGDEYVQTIPVQVDRALMARGRDRFELICATCHGIDGSGDSVVAQNMELRRPPALVEAPVTDYAPGKIFQVISRGYGLMPSFEAQLPDVDRWAVVAYVGALQRSQHMELARLPPAQRKRAQEMLR